jgi:predicted ester cyclase
VSAEENKAVIQRLIKEVYNEGNLDVVDELVAPDIFDHGAVPEHRHGIAGFKHVMEWVRTFSSDVHYDIDDIIAEGEKVAVRMTQSGTHSGQACYGDCPRLRPSIGLSAQWKKGRGREARSQPERSAREHKVVAGREAHVLLVGTCSQGGRFT